MILDTSAIIAIILKEEEAKTLSHLIANASSVAISSATVVETGIVLGNRLGFEDAVLHRFLQIVDAEVIPFSEFHWQHAVRAYQKYGKGRHPAALNFGDCFSYATAKLSKQALLFKGSDFTKTDIEVVDY